MTNPSRSLACLLLLAAWNVGAAPVRTIEVGGRHIDALSAASLFAAGDGYWTQGFDRNNRSYAFHTSAAGERGETHAVARDFYLARGAGNGDVVLESVSVVDDGGCVVERRDSAFALRWRRHLDACYAVPAGAWTWMYGNGGPALLVDATGAGAELQLDNYLLAAAGLDDGDAPALGDPPGPNMVVERLRPDGTVAWRTTVPHEGGVDVADIAVDGSSVVVGIGGLAGSVSRLSLATGVRQWTTPVAWLRSVAQAGGRSWALLADSDGCLASSFDPTTGASSTIRTPVQGARCFETDIAGLADGSLLVLDRGDNVRVAAGAASVAPYALDGFPGSLARMRDGSFRLVVQRNAALETVAIDADAAWRTLAPLPVDVTSGGSAS